MASQEPQRDEPTLAEPARRRLHLREVRSDASDYDGIGSELRAARVRAGVDLADVAQKLRISQAYLEALELGHFDDLPGDVYVFGFLRSYARFLELDEHIAIERYRTEAAGPRRVARLEFPSAMDRGRMPTGRLLLGGLLVAILAYAGWFVLTSEERSTAERVATVPERLAAAEVTMVPAAQSGNIEGATAQASVPAPEELATVVAAPALEPTQRPTVEASASPENAVVGDDDARATEPRAPSQASAAETTIDGSPAAASAVRETAAATLVETLATEEPETPLTASNEEPAVAAPVEDESVTQRVIPGAAVASERSAPVSAVVPVREVSTPPVQPEPSSPVEDNAVRVAQIAEASSGPIAAQNADLQTVTREPDTAAANTNAAGGETQVAFNTPATAPPPPLVDGTDSAPAVAAGGYVPRVFGAGNEGARVVLVAESDSWVQVRAATGELLLTRVLRPGDRYLVPDRPGLVMMTGNVGALRVEVDGEAMRPLGPHGVIGRDIPLDPDKLRSGEVFVDENVSP